MGPLIPNATWTLSLVQTDRDCLLHRVLPAPDGQTALRLSIHPSADKPAPFLILAAAHVVQAVGHPIAPETRRTDPSLQAWGNPDLLASDDATCTFVTAVLARQAARPTNTVLLETPLSA